MGLQHILLIRQANGVQAGRSEAGQQPVTAKDCQHRAASSSRHSGLAPRRRQSLAAPVAGPDPVKTAGELLSNFPCPASPAGCHDVPGSHRPFDCECGTEFQSTPQLIYVHGEGLVD